MKRSKYCCACIDFSSCNFAQQLPYTADAFISADNFMVRVTRSKIFEYSGSSDRTASPDCNLSINVYFSCKLHYKNNSNQYFDIG